MWTGTEAILCCNTTLSKEKDEAHWELVMFMVRNSTLSPHLLLFALVTAQHRLAS